MSVQPPTSEEILVDARGFRCPVPTLKLRRALEAAANGARLRLLADDPMARIDVPHFINDAGCRMIAIEEAYDGVLAFLVVKAARQTR